MRVAAALQALNLADCYFQLAAIGLDKVITTATWHTAKVDEAERWAEHWNGKRNLYVCGNPLKTHKQGRAKAEDIKVTTNLLLDCDPEKTDDDPKGLSEVGREQCRLFMKEAQAWFSVKWDQKMPLVDSGRGFQLWVIDCPKNLDRPGMIARMSEKFKRAGTKLDSTYDASRLFRLPDTLNLKTNREAKFL